MTTLRLRPTGLLAYDNCPQAYHYQYVLGIEPVMTDANLVFGTAVHDACTGWLLAQVEGQPFDPVQTFRAAWEQATATQAIDYPSTFTPTELAATGESLVRQFPAAWEATGLMPLIGPDGQPLVEVRLEAEVVSGVILSGKPDIVAMDREAGIVIFDLKTASSAAAEGFVTVAEQLTAGQVLIETHADRLGIDRDQISALGFMELLKRKPNGRKGPEVLSPWLVPRRDEAALAEFRTKAVWIAEDIARGRFPKRPRMAFNTPCACCKFAGLCQRGDWDGLIRPAQPLGF